MKIPRGLLGMVVVSALLPVLAFALESDLAQSLADEPPAAIAAILPDDTTALTKSDTERGGAAAASTSDPADGDSMEPAPSTTDVGSEAATSSSTDSTAAPSETTTTQGSTASTSTARETTSTTGKSAERASGTITGTACPCTVTGTVELKGEISLQGDLMVKGGTLIARPDVSVEGNGHQIMFMDGGRADFQGTPTFTWSGDGSNANVVRDINFSNLRRIMFHESTAKSTLSYFRVDSSGTSSLGDYSIHFHHNGNSTSGTVVEGVVVTNSRNHAFVPHESHGITFKDTIAMNGRCEAYWWDPPEFQSTSTANNSNNIVYDHALADGVTNCAGDNRGFRLAAFELGPGINNTVKNSVARNVRPSNPKDCAGFHWPELSDKQPSSWTFLNNASYGSSCHGIFVWQNDGEVHRVNGFRGDGISHGAYLNQYQYENVDVEYVEVHALGGWSVNGGKIGTVRMLRHNISGNPVTFADVSISRFIINNASNGGSVPGNYILTNTGLTCSDIEYASVVPGTLIEIDGVDC